MINILLVDDHQVVIDGLKYYFEGSTEFRIAAEANNGLQVLELLANHTFDLIISDISMPQMDGMELVQEIRKVDTNQKILVMSMIEEISHVKKLIGFGVNGYLLKNAKQLELFSAIRSIMDGQNYYSDEVTKSIMNDMVGSKCLRDNRLNNDISLTQREKEVLSLIVEECSNSEIAQRLFISVRTVDSHRRNLMEKTGAKNMAGLVMYAVERNLVPVQKVAD